MKKQIKSDNITTQYILKLMQQKRPDDTFYQMSKRTGIPINTLHNRLVRSRNWEQCILLMRICADLGITMEEALIGKPFPDINSDKIKSLEQKLHQTETKLSAALKELSSLKSKLTAINKLSDK